MSEKPPVKSYCGGKPNYCTPEVAPEVTPDVDAVNMTQERVDETAKGEHEPVAWLIQYKDRHKFVWCNKTVSFKEQVLGIEPLYTAPPKREWVGLDGEIPGLGLVTEEFYNGMLFAEDILRERNGG